MKILVVGAGGVGGFFGGKLAQAGNDVTFIARGEHLKQLKANGLKVKSIIGDFEVNPAKATNTITDVENADLILLGIKAWQLKDMLCELKQIVNPHTIVLPLQNGVLAADELKEQLNVQNIMGGLCRIISKIEAPGIINHMGVNKPTIIFGELDNSKTERVAVLKTLFENAGIHSVASDNIEVELWKKFIMICVSGLLAVTRATYGQLREIAETRQMMIDLLNEIYQLSQHLGIKIDAAYIDETITMTDALPYNSTTSLARDVWEGKPSEIEYQNGTVVRLAQKLGLPTPVNSFVYNCLLPMEKKARSRISH